MSVAVRPQPLCPLGARLAFCVSVQNDWDSPGTWLAAHGVYSSGLSGCLIMFASLTRTQTTNN